MPHQDSERLRAIKTFPSLVKYLRDELDWPVDSDDFEDLTFDYEPEELGIDAKTAAKIDEIKQLRPLTTNQPWGIFFVKFEPKRLPVVALRRVLSGLVIKKRASARASEQAAWNLHDLLFISNYGEGDERQITFAHFSEDAQTGGLPTLKVLGWDDADTVLHIDHVHQELATKLHWPKDESDPEDWRAKWSSAFTLRHREVITTSKELAVRLAALARRIRLRADRVLAIESERGVLRRLHKAFKEALIHDLSESDFADMYAQTVTYGLFSAAVSRPAGVTADSLADMVPITNPFLKEMLGTFLTAGGRKGKIDFDELGLQDVVELLDSPDTHMDAVLRDFGNRTQQEDPVVHFYEFFLAEYDKKKKVQRGVFYTPQPVVSYIVRSVHELLQSEFGLKDGLASTVTWGEMVQRNPDLKLPPLTDEPGEKRTIDPSEPFVQILDPATGTATFLVEVIDVIYKTMTAKWEKQGLDQTRRVAAWNDYVPKHLLPRVYGYELMMAPYAIAHMRLGLKLDETGYRFGSGERARVYLTNALEPYLQQIPDTGIDALAHESAEVNKVKCYTRFTVVIGNPPYNNRSENKTPWIMGLIETYKETVRREETQIQGLSDDYIKFLRLADWAVGISGVGTIGMITNNGFLDGHIFRDLRSHFTATFSSVRLVNLHGDSRKKETAPDGTADNSVFDIMQGVSLTIVARSKRSIGGKPLLYQDIWGERQVKYQSLIAGLPDDEWVPIGREAAAKMFMPLGSTSDDWDRADPLAECFGTGNWVADKTYAYGSGFKSQQDEFAIAFDKADLAANIETLLQCGMTETELRKRFSLCNTNQWSFGRARERLPKYDWRKAIRKVLFRPFDFRYTIIMADVVTNPRREIMGHLERPNLALLATRKSTEGFSVFATRMPCGHKIVGNYDMTTVFPVYRYPAEREGELLLGSENKEVNFSPLFLSKLANILQLKLLGRDVDGLTPVDIFHYAYAVFHSPGYRSRYAEFLKIDFPRLPLTSSLELFRALAELGDELLSLHLMESPKLNEHITTYVGSSGPEVEKVSFSRETVWVDKAQTCGFRGVPEDAWNFHIGGYQVCEKWLKDRRGRTLTAEDLDHYHRIVVALHETIRIMKEIDAVIESHGGWPLVGSISEKE